MKKIEKKGWFWRRKKDYLNNDKVAIFTPQCKNGMIIGGSKGFGFAAADELLSRGANVRGISFFFVIFLILF